MKTRSAINFIGLYIIIRLLVDTVNDFMTGVISELMGTDWIVQVEFGIIAVSFYWLWRLSNERRCMERGYP
jgi:hypothetical protein